MNFFDLWDEQVSLKMYSGDSAEPELYINEKDVNCYPKHLKDEVKTGIYDGELRLDLDDWAFQELKVPAYGSEWAYKRAGYEFCKCLSDPSIGGIEIFKVERWNKNTDLEVYSCNELLRELK